MWEGPVGFREQGQAWCSLAHLALGSLLRPQAKPPAPGDPLCPQGLLNPPGQALRHLEAPSTLWGLLPLSVLLLSPESCSLGPPSPLPGALLPAGLGPPTSRTLLCPPVPSSFQGPPLPSRGSPPPFRDPSLPSGTPSVLQGPLPGHPLPSCVLWVRMGVRPSRADRGGSLCVWRSRETFWSQGASWGPWHDPLHPEARDTAEAPLVGWSLGHSLPPPKAFSGDMCLESIPHPCLNRNLPHTQTPPKPCPSQSMFFSAFFDVGCFGLLEGVGGCNLFCFVYCLPVKFGFALQWLFHTYCFFYHFC